MSPDTFHIILNLVTICRAQLSAPTKPYRFDNRLLRLSSDRHDSFVIGDFAGLIFRIADLRHSPINAYFHITGYICFPRVIADLSSLRFFYRPPRCHLRYRTERQ